MKPYTGLKKKHCKVQIKLFFLKMLFIHLRERERDRAEAGREAEGEREADSPLSREPDRGLDPRSWRS